MFASLLTVCLMVVAPVAMADDPIKDLIDQEVPALKDGTRMTPEVVERAILEACARRKFQASVVSPGLITARWEHGKHSFEVSIPYTESRYSIRYKDSERMDYNPVKHRIDDDYNEYVAGLAEYIEAGLDVALDRLKRAMNPSTRVVRINPRRAV